MVHEVDGGLPYVEVRLADDVACRIDCPGDALGPAERAEVDHRPIAVEEGMLIVEWSKVDHEGCRKVCLADDVAARIDAVCDALGTAERAEVNHRPLRVEEGMMVVDLFAAAADHEGRKVRLADDVAARIDAV